MFPSLRRPSFPFITPSSPSVGLWDDISLSLAIREGDQSLTQGRGKVEELNEKVEEN